MQLMVCHIHTASTHFSCTINFVLSNHPRTVLVILLLSQYCLEVVVVYPHRVTNVVVYVLYYYS